MVSRIGISHSIGVLLFCECMRWGEDVDGRPEDLCSREPGWSAGEYDVMTSEQVYVAVAAHRAACTLQRDLFPVADLSRAWLPVLRARERECEP